MFDAEASRFIDLQGPRLAVKRVLVFPVVGNGILAVLRSEVHHCDVEVDLLRQLLLIHVRYEESQGVVFDGFHL